MFMYTRKDESLILYMQTEKKGNKKPHASVRFGGAYRIRYLRPLQCECSALPKHRYLIPEYKMVGTEMCNLEFNE